MRLTVAEEPEIENKNSTSQLLLEVRDVSKMYHLWESPRARLVHGLWNQVPPWAPKGLITFAQARKTALGHDFYALQGISLALRQGESVAILGRNGSGKSTLLQIIRGTLQPSGGSRPPELPENSRAFGTGQWLQSRRLREARTST